MRKSLIAASIALAALAGSAAAQTGEITVAKGAGKAAIARTVEVTATITAIDAATREVTLKGPQGHEVQVVADQDVKNFGQLKTGDKVRVQYVEALGLELKKGGGLPVARTEQAGADSARPGATPGGMAGRKVTVVGDVIGLDASTRTVTVRGPKRTVEFSIPDPEQFKRIAKGDQIEAQYVEAAAVSIVPQK